MRAHRTSQGVCTAFVRVSYLSIRICVEGAYGESPPPAAFWEATLWLNVGALGVIGACCATAQPPALAAVLPYIVALRARHRRVLLAWRAAECSGTPHFLAATSPTKRTERRRGHLDATSWRR
ncbi:unnamed protein product [Prorocentrum cordatum]|uniref:Uncharacterized protein n=1 Tax=Prorocentrum cordatum TaxID=2364126 RepID=A0ABN9PG51_9DINO|nr:unnamed protein product [Polarella glacialis]